MCLLFMGCKIAVYSPGQSLLFKSSSIIVKDTFGNEHEYDVKYSIYGDYRDGALLHCEKHQTWEKIRHHHTNKGIEYKMQKLN